MTNSGDRTRAILPKTAGNRPATVKRTVLQQLHLVRMWEDHVARYQESLNDFNATPPMTDFENAHGLPRQYIKRHVLKKSKLERMPAESAARRFYAREDVRPFYPVEVVLKHAINVIRGQHLLPVDQTIAQVMAHEIYNLLTARIGPLTFKEPCFTNDWMANFKDVWGYQNYEMKGEAASVDMEKITVDIEQIKPTLEKFALDDIYNCDETGLFLQTTSNWTMDQLRQS